MISAVLAAGLFVAVPVVGRWIVGPLRSPIPAIARPSLWTCAGMAVWSLPLLGSAVLGVYRPEVIGALGWGAVGVLLVAGRVARPQLPQLGRWDVVVLVGVLLAAAAAAVYAADPFTTGRDMGVYANHAVYMVNHGRLDVPYPWGESGTIPPGFVRYAGIYLTEPTMTVQFGHLYPAWLAQTFSVAGYMGLVSLNAVLGVLSLLVIYGIGRRFLSDQIAAVLTVFLAFNPSEIWTTRNTLTEILTQLLIWAGLLLLTAYLARGHVRLGFWAGLLLGLAAVVRIDALLLVPTLLAGHALWAVVVPKNELARPRSWTPVYLGAAPLFTAAVAYYAIFATPYFLDLSAQLRLIGVLTLISGVLLALTRVSAAAGRARSILSSRGFGVALLGGMALVTGYLYFVRPLVPPLSVIDSPGHPLDGMRSHIEDALPNLAAYLSPPIIGAALVGWWFTFVAAARGGRKSVFMPLLLIGLGFSAAYFWNQSIFPDHFWAIRRFVPVVIPAFVLFAAVSIAVGLRRLPRRLKSAAMSLTAALLAATTLLVGFSTYFVREREGSYAALSDFARSLPSDTMFLGLADRFESNAWFTPLFVAFDRQVIPIDVTTDEGRVEAMRRLQTAGANDPVALVTTRAAEIEAIQGDRTAETHISRPLIVATTRPVPRLVWHETVTLTAVQATGLSTTFVRFGAQRSWLVPESGFYSQEVPTGVSARWTDGHARLAIPVEGTRAPSRLEVSLASTGPEGTNLRLLLNGSPLFDEHVAAGPWSGEFGVAGLELGGEANLEIITSTFTPVDPIPGFEDERQFGVMVDGVVLLADQE